MVATSPKTRSSAVAERPRAVSVVETLKCRLEFIQGHWKWYQSKAESLGTVSYSHSIETMVVSLAVSTQYTNVTDAAAKLKLHVNRRLMYCPPNDSLISLTYTVGHKNVPSDIRS